MTLSRPSYAYESAQQSILLPLYRRYLWKWVLDALPRSFPPNAMTIISTVCCAGSFLLATTMRHSSVAMFAAGFLVLCYFTLDNLDGAQARRIGRTSRLGEFLDHWLDTLNNGFVVLGVCIAAGLPDLLAFGVLCFASLAFFAVQWELRCTGVFRVGRVGDIEGNTTVVVLYLALACFGSDALWIQPIQGLPSLAVLAGCGVIAQAIWTLYSALRHVRGDRADLLPIVFSHLILAVWAATGTLSTSTLLTLAFFLNPVFTAGAVCGRLLRLTTPRLDWFVVGALLTGALSPVIGVPAAPHNAVGLTLAAGLASVTFRHFVVALAALHRQSRIAAAEEPVESGGERTPETLRLTG